MWRKLTSYETEKIAEHFQEKYKVTTMIVYLLMGFGIYFGISCSKTIIRTMNNDVTTTFTLVFLLLLWLFIVFGFMVMPTILARKFGRNDMDALEKEETRVCNATVVGQMRKAVRKGQYMTHVYYVRVQLPKREQIDSSNPDHYVMLDIECSSDTFKNVSVGTVVTVYTQNIQEFSNLPLRNGVASKNNCYAFVL